MEYTELHSMMSAGTGSSRRCSSWSSAMRAGLVAGCSIQGQSPTSSCQPSLRSEEHTSELQSQSNLVCRLLLEKKNENKHIPLLPSHQRLCRQHSSEACHPGLT